jgi:hypothetical protein
MVGTSAGTDQPDSVAAFSPAFASRYVLVDAAPSLKKDSDDTATGCRARLLMHLKRTQQVQ